jgi:curved DNA-binding protein CbpA
MPTRKSSATSSHQKSNSTWVLVLGLIAVQSVQQLQAFVVVAPTTGHRDQRYHASISTHSSPSRYQNRMNKVASAAVARITSSRRYLAARTPDLDSTDPFAVLGLEPSPSLDKKEIKRAYKRLALKFHPDVATTKDSPKAEKKAASDKFAKINWAYETLSGKRENSDKTYASKSSTTPKRNPGTASSGYKPPHRRTEAYSQTVGRSTDWRDYMPKYDTDEDDKKYDAGGDSFGSIFSDLFNGASSVADYTASARGGIFTSFIEFLESNVDGYSGASGSGGADDDAQLRILLQTGTLQEIGDEMDDTELVVQQLGNKLNSVQDELVMLEAEVKMAIKYMEKLDLEERVAELQARKTIVETYLKKARKRLLALQTRYKQLIVNGDNDTKAGGGRSSTSTAGSTGTSRQSSTGTSSSSRNDSYSAAGYRSTSSTGSSTSSTSSTGSSSTRTSDSSRSSTSRTGTGSSSKDKEDAWKSDSFGSFGRGRSSGSSSRQRASRSRTSRTTPEPTRTTASTASSSSSSGASDSSQRSSTSTRQTSTQGSSSQDNVPPHRRQNAKPEDQDDSRRMRDLKVDDEFEKLKKELGL